MIARTFLRHGGPNLIFTMLDSGRTVVPIKVFNNIKQESNAVSPPRQVLVSSSSPNCSVVFLTRRKIIWSLNNILVGMSRM